MRNKNLTYTVGEVAVMALIGGAVIGGGGVCLWTLIESQFLHGIFVGGLMGAGLVLAAAWSAGWGPHRG